MKFWIRSIALSIAFCAAWAVPFAVAADGNDRLVGDIRVDAMAEKLELSEQQSAQLDKLVTDFYKKREALKLEGDEVRRRLHNTDLGTLGYGEIISMSREMGRIVSEQTRAMLETQAAFHDLLTPEQQVSFAQLRADDREEREQRLRNQMGQGAEE